MHVLWDIGREFYITNDFLHHHLEVRICVFDKISNDLYIDIFKDVNRTINLVVYLKEISNESFTWFTETFFPHCMLAISKTMHLRLH